MPWPTTPIPSTLPPIVRKYVHLLATTIDSPGVDLDDISRESADLCVAMNNLEFKVASTTLNGIFDDRQEQARLQLQDAKLMRDFGLA